MTRQLLVQGPGKDPVLIRRPIPYHDLVSSPKLNPRQSAAARDLIDRLTKEGLLSANPDSKHSRLISLSQDALLTNWPRLSRLVSEDRHFFAMRERLDESVKLWLSRGQKSDHLLYDRIALAEGETLLRDFGWALNQRQIDYIRKSVAKQKRDGRARKYLGPAAIIGFIVVAVVVAAERFNSAKQSNQTRDIERAQPDKPFANKGTTALEAQLKEAEDKLALGQLNAELAERQRTALQTELKTAEDKLNQLQDAELTGNEARALQTKLKEAEEKLKQVRANSDETYGQLSAAQVKLKQEQDKAQQAQANADSLTSELNALQNQLKQAEAKALAAQQSADLVSSQRSALETQLKDAEAKLKQEQTNSASADSQLSALQAQLKQEQDKGQKAQANADSLTAERNALQNQLKQAEAKVLVAQQNADLASSQRSSLETQLKESEGNLKQAQVNSGGAASQLSALQAQLKQEQEKEQKAQANADRASSQRNALEVQLRETQQKLNPVQEDSVSGGSRVSGLEARLYSPKEVSPIPSPSVASETANPPESESSRDGQAAGEKDSLKEFVLGYLRTVASNDTSVQRRYFADRVNFYGRGVLDSSNVEASTEEYHHEWPIREWTPRGEARIVRLRHRRDRFVVYQPFQWAVSDGSRHAQGNATLYLLIVRGSQGELRIENVHQLDR